MCPRAESLCSSGYKVAIKLSPGLTRRINMNKHFFSIFSRYITKILLAIMMFTAGGTVLVFEDALTYSFLRCTEVVCPQFPQCIMPLARRDHSPLALCRACLWGAIRCWVFFAQGHSGRRLIWSVSRWMDGCSTSRCKMDSPSAGLHDVKPGLCYFECYLTGKLKPKEKTLGR